jgi:16S rRNA (cytidine1402-2'-O)-methyltransferase
MLYIVPTPIGNLGDITQRASDVLTSCDFVIAENPGYTKRLLDKLSLQKPIVQFAEHNELKVLESIVKKLNDQTACIVTDAGTPGISDPGFRLVRACIAENIEVTALPGPNAAITALSASGLPTDKFFFAGFLPKTEFKILELLTEAQTIQATLIAYDSPQRILKTMNWISKSHPECQVVVARELTKVHEEYIRGSAADVFDNLKKRTTIKGEITLLVSFK